MFVFCLFFTYPNENETEFRSFNAIEEIFQIIKSTNPTLIVKRLSHNK